MNPLKQNVVSDTMTEPIIKAELVEPILAERIPGEVMVPPPVIKRTPESEVHQGLVATCWRFIKSAAEWLFGLVSLLLLLSVLATIPILQFLSLGYLLESAARIARPGGRFRDGLFGIRTAARLGSAALGTWILLQPLRLITDFRREAELFAGYADSRIAWNVAYTCLFTLLLGQISWALFRGGRIRSFFWPAPLRLWRYWRTSGVGGLYTSARDRMFALVISLRLPYYFMLGLRGFCVAFAWLVIPISVLVLSSQLPEDGLAIIGAFVGGLMLAFVLLYLPYVQVNFAVSGELRDGFDRRRVRQQFRRAPIAFWMALLITLLLAVPLYLLKAELIPREAAWLPSLVFVLSILPARLLTGWAIQRAEVRTEPRHFIFRQLARLSALPVVLIYALIVYFTQYVSWYGALSLYEQHAFLLPVPFLGL